MTETQMSKSLDGITYSTDISPKDTWLDLGKTDYIALGKNYYYKRYILADVITFDVSDNKHQGNKVVIGGQGMTYLRSQGLTDLDILEKCFNEWRNPTRVDYAIDLMGGDEHDAQHLETLALEKRVKGLKGKKVHVDQRKDIEDSDYTCEIGSRESYRMYRFYRKHAERKLNDITWTRLEMEVKKGAVYHVCMACLREGSISDAMDRFFLDGFDARGELAWFDKIFDGSDPYGLGSVPMPSSDSNYAVYLNQVLQSVKKRVARGQNLDEIFDFERKLAQVLTRANIGEIDR